MFEPDLVIVADHHERAASDPVEIGDRQRRSLDVHLCQLGDDDRIMLGAVGGQLAVEPFEKLRRGVVWVDDAGRPSVSVEHPRDEDELADQVRPLEGDEQRHDCAVAATH